MSDQSYTPSFSVGRTPDEIFDAITNIHGWWKASCHENKKGENDD